jgi:hypothetical protein
VCLLFVCVLNEFPRRSCIENQRRNPKDRMGRQVDR